MPRSTEWHTHSSPFRGRVRRVPEVRRFICTRKIVWCKILILCCCVRGTLALFSFVLCSAAERYGHKYEKVFCLLGLLLALWILRTMKSFIQGIGWLSITLGMLTLPAQVYLLPIIQNFEFLSQGHMLTTPMDYLSRPNCSVAMTLSIVVIVIGIVLVRSRRA